MSELPEILLVNRAIIIENNQLLLLKRSPEDAHNAHLWEFPGGKVDVGEDIFPGLGREVEEETGLIIEPAQKLVYADSEQILRGKYSGKLYVASAHLLLGEMQQGEEHVAYSWNTVDEALEYQLTPESRCALIAFNDVGLV
jgi:mutator protein MutT